MPELNVAFEYQGRQHYEPVAHWGGEGALERLRQRDMCKAQICKRKRIVLIHIDYDMPLTRENVLCEMGKAGVDLLLAVNWNDAQSIERDK